MVDGLGIPLQETGGFVLACRFWRALRAWVRPELCLIWGHILDVHILVLFVLERKTLEYCYAS
jgi:hypothetical protein